METRSGKPLEKCHMLWRDPGDRPPSRQEVCSSATWNISFKRRAKEYFHAIEKLCKYVSEYANSCISIELQQSNFFLERVETLNL
jgi:hypothetical protein